MENVSRYTLISSDKFTCVHRLRKMTKKRYLIDIVPFTVEICKLYLPYSYLDREILQYSHGYAFEYNYLEEDERGRRRRAHDFDFLAEKLGPWCHIDYSSFLPHVEYVDSVVTGEEQERYKEKKLELFEKYDNPRKIVTRLADHANVMKSRYDSLAEFLPRLSGRTVLYTNLVRNNGLIKKYLRKQGVVDQIDYRTYMTHDNRPVEADNVLLFETPINQNRVAVLDVLANILPRANVYYFRNDSKVDRFVFGETDSEWQAIDGLTKEMWGWQCENVS